MPLSEYTKLWYQDDSDTEEEPEKEESAAIKSTMLASDTTTIPARAAAVIAAAAAAVVEDVANGRSGSRKHSVVPCLTKKRERAPFEAGERKREPTQAQGPALAAPESTGVRI